MQVNATDMQLSNVVSGHQITELPLIGRAFTNLELVLPGVQASNDRFTTAFSVNGSQAQQSAYVINGADTNDLPLNTITFQPNVDALQEFNLITGPLNAEYDRNGGAIISTSIKQGTNHFHGDVFEFYRDTFLNTRNFFQKAVISAPGVTPVVTQPTSTFHQNIFGGTIGGPILKDKLFFFFAYQGTRQAIPQTGGNVRVFSAAQLAGNYTGTTFTNNVIPQTISIPGCISGTTTWKNCFTTGQVPISAFNPVATNLVKTYVPSSASGNVYTFSPIQANNVNQYIGRFDFNPTQKNQFYFVGIHEHNGQTRTLPFTGATIPGFGDFSDTQIYQYSAGWVRQISSTALNDLEVHYTRFNFDTVEPQHVVAPSSLGFSISPQNTAAQSVPTIAITGANTSQPLFTLGFSTNGPQPRIDQVYQANDSFAKTFGHHNLKFGYDWRKYLVKNPFGARNNGSYLHHDRQQLHDRRCRPGLPARDSRHLQSGLRRVHQCLRLSELYVCAGHMEGNEHPDAVIWSRLPDRYAAAQSPVRRHRSDLLHSRPTVENLRHCAQEPRLSRRPGCNNASGSTTKYTGFGPRFGFAWAPQLGFLSGARGLSIRGGFGIYYNRTEEEVHCKTLATRPSASIRTARSTTEA